MFEEYYAKLVQNECQNISRKACQISTANHGGTGSISSMAKVVTVGNMISTTIAENTPITHLTNFEKTSVVNSSTTTTQTTSGVTVTSAPTLVSGLYPNNSNAKASIKIKANGRKSGSKEINVVVDPVTSGNQLPSSSYSTPLAGLPQMKLLENTIKYSAACGDSGVQSCISRPGIEDAIAGKSGFGVIKPSLTSKTLQEKLAEKQKLLHSAELTASINNKPHIYPLQQSQVKQSNDTEECIEVIVLD